MIGFCMESSSESDASSTSKSSCSMLSLFWSIVNCKSILSSLEISDFSIIIVLIFLPALFIWLCERVSLGFCFPSLNIGKKVMYPGSF